MPNAIEILRSLEEQGLVERIDLEETDGDPAEIIKNVFSRLNPEQKSKRDNRKHRFQKDKPA